MNSHKQHMKVIRPEHHALLKTFDGKQAISWTPPELTYLT